MRRIGMGVAVLALAGCGRPATVEVDHAWVRLSAVTGRPAAGYFTLHGGAVDTTLVGVRTGAAARAELHESMAGGMRAIPAVQVPAGGTLAFQPGGRHVMLFDPDPRLMPGRTVPITLLLADRQLTATATVVGPADPAP